MRLGGCLYRFRRTNLDWKRDQKHLNELRLKTRFWHQVDHRVDHSVDLVMGRSTPQSTPQSTWLGGSTPQSTWVYGREFSRQPSLGLNFEFLALFSSCFILFKFLKLRRVITWSYRLRFSKTQTRFHAEFRDERKGATRFPLILILKFNSALIYDFNML